ncbi:HEAT repeat domain-containing protein [Pleurocapsa sp. PCC 7319]|uniref:HEAT repeat domain-containing protein n=1 Tax=Pleurocapsa sp. PCC 7319 TaxID=118161 RepID=UPI000345D49F|nr:HEAT repeat domain-containing protein [Pleurocapsa sp. PCC 7319]
MNNDRLEQIKLNLRDNAINIRKAALDELAKMPSNKALPVLKQLAQDHDFALRKIAVMGFGNHLTEESFQILKNILETEQDANVLAEAANSIFEFGDRAIPPLQNLFTTSDNWLVRQTVISILVDSDNSQVLLQVANEALSDEDQTTKETGILALSRLLNSPLKQEALQLFSILAEDTYWRTRWRTAIALTASQDIKAKELLAKLQQDEHYRVVAAALEQPLP